MLARILTSCLELQTSSATEAAAPDLGRSMAEWLKLQNSISMLMDSTMADNPDVQVGLDKLRP